MPGKPRSLSEYPIGELRALELKLRQGLALIEAERVRRDPGEKVEPLDSIKEALERIVP